MLRWHWNTLVERKYFHFLGHLCIKPFGDITQNIFTSVCPGKAFQS
jgi:hypothetical protein